MSLPPGWVSSTLNEVSRIVSGYGFPESLQGRISGEIPFYKVGDISEAWKNAQPYLRQAQHYISQKEAKSLRASPFPADTVVFAKIGAAIALNRRALLSAPSLVDNNVMGLISVESLVSPRYLFYFTWTLRLNDISQATTVPSVRKTDVEQIEIPVPPRSEQDRIVAEIEKQLTRLDDAVTALKRVQANLKRYRASVLKAACEGRLVPTEAELARKEGRDYEPAGELLKRILAERRAKWESDQWAKMIASGKPPKDNEWKKKYKEPEPPDESFAFEVPQGWAIASVDQLCSAITSGSRDWSPYYGRGSGVFIMAQNVRPMRFDLSFVQTVDPPADDSGRIRCAILKDDLLVTIVGANTGDVCRVPSTFPEHYVCQSVAFLRPVHPALSRYLELYLNSPENGQRIYKKYIYGAGRPHLSFDQLKTTPVLLPPISELERIQIEVEVSLGRLDAIEKAAHVNREKTGPMRHSILRRAFSGNLVAQDPNDEPASVLLERIRAERAQQAASKPTRKPRTKRERTIAVEE